MDQQLPSIHMLVVDDSSAIREVLTQRSPDRSGLTPAACLTG